MQSDVAKSDEVNNLTGEFDGPSQILAEKLTTRSRFRFVTFRSDQ